MKTPEEFEPVSEKFKDMLGEEYLIWVPVDSDRKYYPEFFRRELKNPCREVKHFVVDDRT